MERIQKDIIKTARSWIGTPYHHQGRIKSVGCDCCGLVIGVARELGLSDYDVDGYSPHADGVSLLKEFGENCDRVEYPEPGDILVFRIRKVPQHCGIMAEFAGTDTVIHAYQSLGAVKEHALESFWRSRIVGAFRYRCKN